jgi:hypothetical protein
MQQSPHENLTGPQPVTKFPAFDGSWRFITAFTTSRHLSLFWARTTQPMTPSHFLKIHFNIMLPSLPSGLFLQRLSAKTLYAPLLSLYVLHDLHISFLIWSPE